MFKDERNASSAKDLVYRKIVRKYDQHRKLLRGRPETSFNDILDALHEIHVAQEERKSIQERLAKLKNRPLWKKILDNLF